jgi:hypothetical protein
MLEKQLIECLDVDHPVTGPENNLEMISWDTIFDFPPNLDCY